MKISSCTVTSIPSMSLVYILKHVKHGLSKIISYYKIYTNQKFLRFLIFLTFYYDITVMGLVLIVPI